MISSVVVSYKVRPEAVDEHVRLIEGVFEQLQAEQPDNVEYKVIRLDDGVSFVHVSTADTPDGSNPLPELEAFRSSAATRRPGRHAPGAHGRRHHRLVLPGVAGNQYGRLS